MTPKPPLAVALLAVVLPHAAQLAGAQSPQGPGSAIAHVHAFPDSTLACVSLTATPQQLEVLQRNAVVRTLLSGITRGSHWLAQRLLRDTGIETEHWQTLLHRGVSVGLTDFAESGEPCWLLVADAADKAPVFAAALDRMRQRMGASVMVAEHGRARTWVVTTPLGRTAFAIDDARLVIGDGIATVTAALDRMREPERAGVLATTPGFAEFELAVSVQRHRLLAAWLRPNRLAERALQHAPADLVGKARGVLRALDLTRVAGAGMTVALDGTDFVETYHVEWPAPRNGPLAELIAPKAVLRAEAAALVPADVDSFSMSAIDLQRVWHAGMRLFGELAPREADRVQAMLVQFGDALGVNVQDELLGRLGTQVVTLQWAGANDAESAVLVQLTDAQQFDRALRRVIGGMDMPVREEAINGYRALVLEALESGPVITVTEDSLVFASSTRAMQRALDQLAAPRGAATAVQVPAGASAWGLTKLAPMLRQAATALGTRLPGIDALPDLAGALHRLATAAGNGRLESLSTHDDRMVTVTVRSPLGGAVTMAAALGAAAAMSGLPAQGVDAASEPRGTPDLRATLAAIVAAERAAIARPDSSGALSLGELVREGLLAESDVGRAADDSTYERGGYRLTVLRDPGKDKNAFIAVAWPAGQRKGTVYAATTEYPMLVNELIAGAAGMASVELDDVYVNGFGSKMRSGWRVEDGSSAAMNARAADGSGAALVAAVAALQQADNTNRDEPLAVLRAALTSQDAEHAAFAARAVGRLRLVEEVPSLVTLVGKHHDVGVRTQAMWSLLQFGDPRSKQVSVEALSAPSAELRALAAANLGKLRARDASQALLGLLAKSDEADQRDRATALLALADMGDPAPLLQCAASVTEGDAATVQALAYAFQTLSPLLPRKEEAKTLVAVLEHPLSILRRYAIQRLGELREPVTARALEGRLAHEERELLPLLQVALQAVRGTAVSNETPPVGEMLQTFAARVAGVWNGLSPNHRYAVIGGAVALVALLALVGVLRNRARLRAQGNAWAAMASATPLVPPEGVPHDEVDLHIGESGIYTGRDDDESGSLMHSQSGMYSSLHR